MTAFLECRHVTKMFGGGLFSRGQNTALEDFSLEITSEPPSITAIVGESGSGKTTLARLLLGLITPTRGEVLYQGKELPALSGAGRRQFLRDVQVIMQDPYEVYNPFYRVDHVLQTPIRKFGLAHGRDAERHLTEETLRAVGLRPDDTLGRHPHQLSGGQRQRIMVARALLLKPKLIIADEPVSMVAASLRATILGSLRQLTDEHGISILYITHDLATAYQVSDAILVMYRAQIVEAGAIEPVVTAPQHPYTRLLVSAIPRAETGRQWLASEEDGRREGPPRGDVGCCFADRCPQMAPDCLTGQPGLHRTAP